MSRRRACLFLLLLGLGSSVVLASPTSAATTLRVQAGQSIQAAIERAKPGDTIVVEPGTYRENLTILKDGITLRGSGTGPRGTRLIPPSTFTGRSCIGEQDMIPGICVAGEVDFDNFTVRRPLQRVRISGFEVRDFFTGIFLAGVNDAVVEHNAVHGNSEGGMDALLVQRPRLRFNTASGNDGGGIRVLISPNLHGVIQGNTITANSAEGILLEDIEGARVLHNRLSGNAAGIAVLDIETPRQLRPTDVDIRANDVVANNRSFRDVNGGGILLIGALDSTVAANRVRDHRPQQPTPLSGGIVVASASALFGGGEPQNNLVRNNLVFNNQPVDLRYDGTGTHNRFHRNHCNTSQPDNLCH